MKKFAWLLPFIGLAACSSPDSNAGREETPQLTAPNVASVVFFDKSLSVNPSDAFIRQKYQQALTKLIADNITQKGDRLEVYFIHDNTAKGKALERVAQSEKEDVSSANQTDAEAAQTSFEVSLQKEQQKFLREAYTLLVTPNASRSNRYTDILASLPILDRLAERNLQVRAYYFSDMVESMPGANQRDFQQTPPRSTEQAETWAKQDAERLKPALPHLATVETYLVLPFAPTASSKLNNPHVTEYWETLFRELGVTKRLEEVY
jgi:hypothetical protein